MVEVPASEREPEPKPSAPKEAREGERAAAAGVEAHRTGEQAELAAYVGVNAEYYLERFGKPSEFIPYGAETGAVDSRETLDRLYNTHVKRFYSDRQWRRRFRRRLWQHRRSLTYLLRHLPDFLSAMRTFEPDARA